MTYSLRLLSSTLALLAAACGPGTDSSDTSGSDTASTNAESTADTTADTTAGTTAPTTTAGTGDATSNSSSATGSSSDPTATTGDPVCPDVFPTDGTPCDAEGLTCGGPCEDPCAFCNVIRCEQGIWTGLEVFPAECLDCDASCTFVVAAACPGGPPDQAACVTGCQAIQGGACGILYNETLACAGGMPTFTCDPMTRPTIAGCEAQFDALYQCTGT